MKKSRKIVSMLLALTMSATVCLSVFAAEPNVTVSTNEAGETVYTQTIDMDDVLVPYVSSSSTKTASQSLGLFLDAGKSNKSTPVEFHFISLPKNAKVRSIEIKPGHGIINNNRPNMLGAVVFTKITITSPYSKTTSLTWKPYGMTDKTSFFNETAKGTWTAYVTGTNLTNPTGDPVEDLIRAGNLIYKTPQMTISYVVD